MSNNQKIPEITLEEKQKQLEALQADVDIIFAEAITNQVITIDFAIKVWVKAVQQKAPYVCSDRQSHDSPQHKFSGRRNVAIPAIFS